MPSRDVSKYRAMGAEIGRKWSQIAPTLTADELRYAWPKVWFACCDEWPGIIEKPPDDIRLTRQDVEGSEPPNMPTERFAAILQAIGLPARLANRLLTVPVCRKKYNERSKKIVYGTARNRYDRPVSQDQRYVSIYDTAWA